MTEQISQPTHPNPKLEDGDPAVLDLPVTIKPVIDMENPDEYFTPREMYAKALLNSPVEFSTINISVPDERNQEPGVISTRCHEIDMAVHPQLGALVCGSVYPEGRRGEALREAIEDQVEILSEQRRLVGDMLEKDGRLYSDTPPIGIFITLQHSTKQDLPHEWDHQRATLAPEDDISPLHIHMQAAMSRIGELDGWHNRSCWPRLMAILREQHHVSALQWLMIYEAI